MTIDSFEELFEEYCQVSNNTEIQLDKTHKTVRLYDRDQIDLVIDGIKYRYLTGGKRNITALILALTKLRDMIDD